MSAEHMKSKFVRLSVSQLSLFLNAQISFKFWLLLPLGLSHMLRSFLALLDYISRAHEIEIFLSFLRVAIISVPNAQISFKFLLLLPWAICSYGFWVFEHFF